MYISKDSGRVCSSPKININENCIIVLRLVFLGLFAVTVIALQRIWAHRTLPGTRCSPKRPTGS